MNSAPQLKPYQFKPGQIANPSGRPRLSPELRMIKSLSGYEVAKMISKYARMNLGELLSAMENPTQPILDKCICKVFQKSLKESDYLALNFLLDRAIGKTPIVDLEESQDKAEVNKMSLQELLQAVKAIIPNIEAKDA